MLNHVLVPLDDSDLSKQTLIAVRRIVGVAGTRVRLLTAVDPLPFRHTLRPFRGAGDEALVSQRVGRAEEHLQALVEDLKREGLDATCKVMLGTPADVILNEVESSPPSLVAMTSHGRGGITRWIRGSVAQRVLRHCSAPLLLLRARQDGGAELDLRRILVPLDGSHRADLILPLVEELAALYGAEVILLRVGWEQGAEYIDSSEGPVVATPRLLDESLHPARDRLLAKGLKVRTRAAFGEVTEKILDAQDEEEVDLVALTTHGLTGLSRWVLGSVAEKVLRDCRTPVLVLRTQQEALEGPDEG
jgi:nucleotide-binding universal stress UspA family protein